MCLPKLPSLWLGTICYIPIIHVDRSHSPAFQGDEHPLYKAALLCMVWVFWRCRGEGRGVGLLPGALLFPLYPLSLANNCGDGSLTEEDDLVPTTSLHFEREGGNRSI